MIGNVDGVAALLQVRAVVDAPDQMGMTALHWSVRSQNEELALVLLAARADTTIQDRRDGMPPLHVASERGGPDLVRALLEGRAGTDTTDARGRRPLELARQRGHAQVVALLEAAQGVTDDDLGGGGRAKNEL